MVGTYFTHHVVQGLSNDFTEYSPVLLSQKEVSSIQNSVLGDPLLKLNNSKQMMLSKAADTKIRPVYHL